MQEYEKNFLEKSESKNQAPGIFSILGAVILDIALVLLFWFIGMIAITAICTTAALLFNVGHIASAGQPGATAQLLIALLAMYLAILVLFLWRGRKLQLVVVQSIKKSTQLAVITGASLFLLTLLSSNLLEVLGLFSKPGNQQILEDVSKQWPIAITFFAVLIAPIFEELFFRKQLFTRMVQADQVLLGYVISSLLFALLHEPAPTAGVTDWLLKLVLYGSMGAAFAWVYRRTGRLWPAIAAHGCNNLLGIVILLAFK